jgi:AraC-like DNA-binding protein
MGARPPLRFSTSGIPEAARGHALCTLRGRGLLPVEPLPDAVPAVELVKWRLPGASLLSGRFCGVRQIGDPGTGGGPDDLFFGINLAGPGLARQRGREVDVDGGDGMVVGLHDGPFTVLRPVASRMIGIRVPRSGLPARIEADTAGAVRFVPARTPALQLLTRYLRSVLDGPVPTGALADTVVDHITELIALSLGASAEFPTAVVSVRAARLQSIKGDIARNLTDPAIRASSVAARHGISARYLHRLFEDEGRTFSRYVLDQRLELVHRRLRNPRFTEHTITAIASGAGFTDPSYFSRAFRRRYGATPTDVRRGKPGTASGVDTGAGA